MGYETYLFDMDGTLLDTIADLASAVNHTLAQYGYPQHTVEQVRMALGNGAVKLMAAMLPQGEATPEFAAMVSGAFLRGDRSLSRDPGAAGGAAAAGLPGRDRIQ